MKLISKLLAYCLILLLLVSCAASETNLSTANKVDEKDYNSLQSRYEQLKNEYDKEVQKVNDLQNDNDRLKQSLTNQSTNNSNDADYYNSVRAWQISSLLNEIRFYQTEAAKNKSIYEKNNLDLSILNIYNENLVKAGDKIAGLEVKNTNAYKVDDKGLNTYVVEFYGEFVLTGKIIPDGHSGGIIIEISNGGINNIPHTVAQGENGMTFKPSNNDMLLNELKKIAPPMNSADELEQYLIENNKQIIIKAKFSDLIVNFLIGKYVSNSANIIEILELKIN